MSGKIVTSGNIQGLSSAEAARLQEQFGKNFFHTERPHHFAHIVWNIIKEPMFLLLVVACSLYFMLGETAEGLMMLAAMLVITVISLYQEVRSANALKALKELSEPTVAVLRDGAEVIINVEHLVPGDIMLLSEGMKVPADAIILQANDFTVNESIITGESMPVEKSATHSDSTLFQGTTVNSGKCIARVVTTGMRTQLGKIGGMVSSYQPQPTVLQRQINLFIRRLALFGFLGFSIILFVNYLNHRDWVTSLLFALALAMSVIPEEIPVAFSSFMALGAYKMSRLGIITRQPQIIEHLGSVNVLCLDKTGTITQNKMKVAAVYEFATDKLVRIPDEHFQSISAKVIYYAALASETDPFDEMEKAIWDAHYSHNPESDIGRLKMIYEFPLEGIPPMMTHVYNRGDVMIAAAKGAAEAITRVCRLEESSLATINRHAYALGSQGYRVIAVASTYFKGPEIPISQDAFSWTFEGLLALYDPPRENVTSLIKSFYDAGIDVKIVSGDYPETSINIARQVGIENYLKCVTGEEVMHMDVQQLSKTAKAVNVFARMYPDAKLKLIEAIKANGAVVVMTGDGVNDAPALKSADIGIAMGRKGTGIARQAADLIITDDNLERIFTAIREGRRIFSNLKKAIHYIVAIHIPIILVASVPVIFGWIYPNIFTPIHVIFLELIMGPTCSIFFEREPVEEDVMRQRPRQVTAGIFSREELLIAIIQGVIIAIGALGLYYYFMNTGASIEQTRSIVFTGLILSNLFLTFANRSFTRTVYFTSHYKNNLAVAILVVSAIFLIMLHFIPSVQNMFQLGRISLLQFSICFATAFVSVSWFEIYKLNLKQMV
jgi:P-type Ca2+ transporter type 2C